MSKEQQIIWVVDDDESTREILTMILQNSGYSVIAFEDSNINLSQTTQWPDLIILDNDLRCSRTGAEICREIKNNQASAQIPIILASGLNDLDKIAGDVCANDYLAKPYNLPQLTQLVSKHLKAKVINSEIE